MQFTKEQIDKQREFAKVLAYQMEKAYTDRLEAEEHHLKCIESFNRENEYLREMLRTS